MRKGRGIREEEDPTLLLKLCLFLAVREKSF
jgi:hypothetical protein